MKHYVKDNQLFFETEKATYTVICEVELKGFQDFYVEDENGTFDFKNRKPINEPYDIQSNGYFSYYIYEVGDEKTLVSEYIGNPTENFSVEWVENTINEYEEENK